MQVTGTYRFTKQIKSIEYGAFVGCRSLQHISLPDGLTSIDFSAFEDCTSLRSIHLPDSVTEVDICIDFNDIYIEEIIVSEEKEEYFKSMFPEELHKLINPKEEYLQHVIPMDIEETDQHTRNKLDSLEKIGFKFLGRTKE